MYETARLWGNLEVCILKLCVGHVLDSRKCYTQVEYCIVCKSVVYALHAL